SPPTKRNTRSSATPIPAPRFLGSTPGLISGAHPLLPDHLPTAVHQHPLAEGTIMDVESRIRAGRMTGLQTVAVINCMLTGISDGYDILAVALAVPYFSKEWGLGPAEIGYVISGATAGMVVGALGLAPLGD